MNMLNTKPNIENADGFYEELIALHDGRNKDESDAINAKLVLILANHIGDREILAQALTSVGSSTGGSAL